MGDTIRVAQLDSVDNRRFQINFLPTDKNCECDDVADEKVQLPTLGDPSNAESKSCKNRDHELLRCQPTTANKFTIDAPTQTVILKKDKSMSNQEFCKFVFL